MWRLWQNVTHPTLQAVAVKAVLYAYNHQDVVEGFFNNVYELPPGNGDALDAAFFFLSYQGHVELLVPDNAELVNLRPKYNLAFDFLQGHIDRIHSLNIPYTNQLVFAAQAFILGAITLDRPDLMESGRSLMKLAISQQDPAAGWYPERTKWNSVGWDSSYHAVTMLRMGITWSHMEDGPDRTAIFNSLQRGAEWLKSRVSDTGVVDTTGNTRTGPDFPDKPGNLYEIAMALYYWSEIGNDEAAFVASERIAQHILDAVR